jgi:hypothetical protein
MTEIKLNPWETPAAPPSPLRACCTSSIGPVCGHNVTLYGPAHFRSVPVTEMRPGDVCDFQRWATGEVFYRAVAEVTRPAPGIVTIEFEGGGYWELAASAQARIAGSDAVTRRRIARGEL